MPPSGCGVAEIVQILLFSRKICDRIIYRPRKNDKRFYLDCGVAGKYFQVAAGGAVSEWRDRAERKVGNHAVHNSVYAPLGRILLAGDQAGLTGLWFAGQKYYARYLDAEHEEREIPVLTQTKKWLDLYFSGKVPDFVPQLHFTGSDFQKEVWEILLTIPYGKTMTYGEIAAVLAKKRGLAHMSAQAVGGAVGRNEISVIVPCHRVVGADGSLTGYAGGLDKKIWLLTMEGAGMDTLYRPKRGTAL